VRPGALSSGWRLLLAVLLSLNAAAYLVFFARYVDFPYEIFGWAGDHILYNAWQITRGEPVFVDPARAMPTAFLYTPGYTLMLAPLVALFGPHPWTGRVLTMAGLAVLGACLFVETMRRTQSRGLAFAAPGLLLLYSAFTDDNMFWIHPDLWSTTLGVLALMAARRAAGSSRALPLAVLLAVAAVFTKQTAIGFVGAAFVFLLFERRRTAWIYGLLVGALLALVFLLMQALTEGQFALYMLLPLRQPIQPHNLVQFAEWVLMHLGLMLPALFVFARDRGRAGLLRDPFVWAIVIALPPPLAAMFKVNGWINNLLGLVVVLIPVFLHALHHGLQRMPARPARRHLVYGALLLLFVAGRVALNVQVVGIQLREHGRRLGIAARVEQVLAESEGPAWMSHRIAFAFRNGLPVHTPAAMVLEFRPAVDGIMDGLVAQIEAQEFGTILLTNDARDFLRWSEFEPVLRRHYRPVESIGAHGAWNQLTPVYVFKRRL
jgi:hypothetical protein